MINISIIGYNFSYFKGTYRNNLFHSELAFLVMVGAALVADGFGVHFERGFIYAAMVFAGGVEALNLLRAKRRKKRKTHG